MHRNSRNIALTLLLIFAMFFCGNTFFVHVHSYDNGNRVVHSHPYLPGSAHSHSDSGLIGLAQMNAALNTLIIACRTNVPEVPVRRISIGGKIAAAIVALPALLNKNRAPPATAA